MDSKHPAVFFHQMFPNGDDQNKGILQLLLHFKWTWIGVIYLENDIGEKFVQHVLPMFSQHGICFDIIERFPQMRFFNGLERLMADGLGMFTVVKESTANVLVVHGDIQTIVILRILLQLFKFEDMPVKGKVWLMTAQTDFTSLGVQRDWEIDFLHGAISLVMCSTDIPGFKAFLQTRNPIRDKDDGFIWEFWQQAFHCLSPDSEGDKETEAKICTGTEKLETLPGSVFEMTMTPHSYSIYNGVHAVAQGLQAMRSSKFKHRRVIKRGRWQLLNQQPWQVTSF